jgi:hypothetical protein
MDTTNHQTYTITSTNLIITHITFLIIISQQTPIITTPFTTKYKII